MPLRLHEQTATLTGTVTVDDAEAFTTWLRTTAGPSVDLRDCTHLHTAVFQAILVFAPTVTAGPTEPLPGPVRPAHAPVGAGNCSRCPGGNK